MEMSAGEFVTYSQWSKQLHPLRSGAFTYSNTNLILVIYRVNTKSEKLWAKFLRIKYFYTSILEVLYSILKG
jgi:hypothetical protein